MKSGYDFRVMVVEDHADTCRDYCRLLKLYFARAGFDAELVGVGDVATAKRILDEEGPFDFLMTDSGLPDGTGIELIQALRSGTLSTSGTRADLPVIVASGFGMEMDVERSRSVGAVHFTKPVDMPQVAIEMGKMVGLDLGAARG